MHVSIEEYLSYLNEMRRSPLTLKAARQDLRHFVVWWEERRKRSFAPDMLLYRDVRDWQIRRQKQDGASPATINRALSALRGYCRWSVKQGLMTDNPMMDIEDVPTTPLGPRGLPDEAVDAILRSAHAQTQPEVRLRDESVLVLLAYAGLRVQEVCDIQLRDIDIPGSTVTVRSGKAGRTRRVPLHPEAQRILQKYLDQLRCPQGLPPVGNSEEIEPLIMRKDMATTGQPFVPGISQRMIQRVVRQLGKQAAVRLKRDTDKEQDLERAAMLEEVAYRLERVTPHQLRHSLAQRMLRNGAQLSEVQHVLGHSRLSTTGMYLTPGEEDLYQAIRRAGL